MTTPGGPQPAVDGRPVTTHSAYQPLSASGLPLPPSLATPTAGLPGLDPSTTSVQVAAAVAAQQAQATSVVLTQAKIMSGDIERDFRAVRDHVKAIGDTLRGIGSGTPALAPATTAPGAAQAGAPTPKPADRQPGSAGRTPKPVDSPEEQVARTGRTTQRMAGGEPEGALPGPAPIRGMGYNEARSSFSLAGIRERAAAGAARGLQNRVGRYQLQDGTWTEAATGRELSALGGRLAGIGNQGIKALSAVAQGESLSTALPGLGRVSGPVGFAVGAGSWAVSQAQNQREQNRVYQNVTGGPNFSLTDPNSGFRQRLGENMFGWSQIGTMGSSQARALYRGVTEMGVSAQTRTGALDFASTQYRKVGMDPQQALDLVNKMVSNGVDAFGTLSTALDKVSDTARKAGANVGAAEKSFGAVLGSVQQNVTGTAAAPTIAAGLQTELTRQGHTLAGQLDFTGMLSQPSLMMQAASLGQDPMSYMAKIQQQPALMGQGLQSQVDRIRDAVFSREALAWAHTEGQKAMQATGGQLTPAGAAEIGRQMAQRGMLNAMQFMQVAASLGLGGVTPANVYEVAAKVALGGFRFDQSLAGSDLPDRGTTVGGQGIVTNAQVAAAKAKSTGPGNPQEVSTQGGQASQIADAIGQGYKYVQSGRGGTQRTGGPDTTGAEYISSVQQSGSRSAVLEALLKDPSFKDKHFVVQSAKGPIAVNFEQAFGQYQDQLRHGDVTIQETGETVAQTTGKLGDQTGTAASAGQAGPAGAGAPGQVAGSVAIYADDELKKILRFATGGGAYIDSSQRSGNPAPAFPSTPADYPVAGGH